MKQPKRRFVGLAVGEVSLVDSPANEVDFLVKKALEDEMAGKTGGAEAVEISAGEGEHVAKALEHVANIVSTVKSSMGITDGVVEKADIDSGDAETEKAKKGATLGAMVKAMGFTKKEDYDAQMAKLTKQFGLDANAKFQNMQPPVAKAKKPPPAASNDTDDDDDADDEDEDDDNEPPAPKAKAKKSEPAASPIDTLMSAISKATTEFRVEKAKTMTKARVASLKAMQETLKLLIAEVEEATQPAVTMPAGDGTTFNSSGIKDLESPMEQPVIKSMEDLAAVVAKAVTAATAPLKAEIEAIKKAKPASSSLEGEGGTVVNTKKSSLWGGLL